LKVPDLDLLVVAVSGGGLSSGMALATHYYRNQDQHLTAATEPQGEAEPKGRRPPCKVVLAEPEGKELGECLRRRQRLWPNPPRFVDTIAEGIRTQQAGHLTFPILCQLAETGEPAAKTLALLKVDLINKVTISSSNSNSYS